MHIVVAAKPDADQPWVADAVANLAKQTGASVAVVSVDEVELERLAAAPRSVFTQAGRAGRGDDGAAAGRPRRRGDHDRAAGPAGAGHPASSPTSRRPT